MLAASELPGDGGEALCEAVRASEPPGARTPIVLVAPESAAPPSLPMAAPSGSCERHGKPVAGIVVKSVNPDSAAIVLDGDGDGDGATATSCNGRFVILNPTLAERFEVEGFPGIGADIGTAADAVFVHAITLP